MLILILLIIIPGYRYYRHLSKFISAVNILVTDSEGSPARELRGHDKLGSCSSLFNSAHGVSAETTQDLPRNRKFLDQFWIIKQTTTSSLCLYIPDLDVQKVVYILSLSSQCEGDSKRKVPQAVWPQGFLALEIRPATSGE